MISTLKNKLNKKGFTLAELLIVVAIIAILVAIAIPVFNGATEAAAKATDEANLRAAKAEASTFVLLTRSGDTTYTAPNSISTTNVYYDYTTDTWKAAAGDAYKGKSNDNKTECIKATYTGSGTTLDVTVDWG